MRFLYKFVSELPINRQEFLFSYKGDIETHNLSLAIYKKLVGNYKYYDYYHIPANTKVGVFRR